MSRTSRKKIAILDEGIELTDDANSINFTGSGVTGTEFNNDVEEEINAGAGAVSSVSSSDGSITASPTTGAVDIALNPVQVDGSAFTTVDLLSRQLWDAGEVVYDWSSGVLYPSRDIAFPNDVPIFSIGSDPSVFKTGNPLRLYWTTSGSSNGWFQFDDGAGNLQVIRANINADSVLSATGSFTSLTGGTISGSGTGITGVPIDAGTTGTLPASRGGTGQSSYSVGDILYASGASALSKLSDVATGNALISRGVNTAPSWGKIGLTTHVSGTLGVGNGGTGTATAFTSGSLVFAGASGVYSQNNSNLFWNNTTLRLGIGTASPSAAGHFSSATPSSVGTSPGTAGNPIFLLAGGTGGNTTIATTGVGGTGGTTTLISGNGGSATAAVTSATGGNGGAFSITSGTGGATTLSSSNAKNGGVGGTLSITGGAGGAASGTGTGTNTGGIGSAVTITGGTGGAAFNGTGTNTAGTGGDVTIKAGPAGFASAGGNGGTLFLYGGQCDNVGGTPGDIYLFGGTAGAGGSGCIGGSFNMQGGNASGDNTVSRAGGSFTMNGGSSKGDAAGGTMSLTGGRGGAGTGTLGVAGGAVTITGGPGGIGSATGGTGGALNLRGGLGGDSGTDGAGGAIVFSTAATITHAEAARFLASGDLQFADAKNIAFNATTGTKIGTATSQKMGFWNAAPIVQPTTGVAAATRVGGGGTALTDTDTFDGYTLSQVVKALRNSGLLA